jgi:hypothetical protein
MNKEELPDKYCQVCGKQLRKNPEFFAYQVGICSNCTKSNPDLAPLRRQVDALRNRKYYETHQEKEIERSANYKKRKRKTK